MATPLINRAHINGKWQMPPEYSMSLMVLAVRTQERQDADVPTSSVTDRSYYRDYDAPLYYTLAHRCLAVAARLSD